MILPTFNSSSRTNHYSDGVFLGVDDEGLEVNTMVRCDGQRGSISNYGDAYSAVKKNGLTVKNVHAPNLQHGDRAFLPTSCGTLRLKFSMNMLPVSADAQSTNNIEYNELIEAFICAYKESGSFDEIANLVIWRIANASMLWRNLYGINKKVSIKDECTGVVWNFDSQNLSVKSPSGFVAPPDLLRCVSSTLSGDSIVLMLSVVADVFIGNGMEFYPSQELPMISSSKSAQSKFLYTIPHRGTMTAGMHPQKIGAAVRAFDIWHPGFSAVGPISMEPLGYSQHHRRSFRTPLTKTDLYTSLMRLEEITQTIKSGQPSHAANHIIGCLMRGGVFSYSDQGESKTPEKTACAASTLPAKSTVTVALAETFDAISEKPSATKEKVKKLAGRLPVAVEI